jgi:hypothetical protein
MVEEKLCGGGHPINITKVEPGRVIKFSSQVNYFHLKTGSLNMISTNKCALLFIVSICCIGPTPWPVCKPKEIQSIKKANEHKGRRKQF